MRLFANFTVRDNLRNISIANWEIFLYSKALIFVNRFVHFHKYYGDIKLRVFLNVTPCSLVGANDANVAHVSSAKKISN